MKSFTQMIVEEELLLEFPELKRAPVSPTKKDGSNPLEMKKLKHLFHPEEQFVIAGDAGISHAADVLDDIEAFLTGKEPKNDFEASVKYDGAPSITFGINPDNGRFFVGSKSVFNKTPKINYTPKDIDRNHEKAPGLAAKLKEALKYLPKIMPATGGIYAGDFMYGPGDVKKKGTKLSFTPNTITYSTLENSAVGRRVAKSQIGIVVHVEYEGRSLADMKVKFNVDQAKFKKTPEVNMIDPTLKPGSGEYGSDEAKMYKQFMTRAAESYAEVPPEVIEAFGMHDAFIRAYMNKCVRDEKTPDIKGYTDYLSELQYNKTVAVKSLAAKEKRAGVFDLLLSDVETDPNGWTKAFELMNSIGQAKNVLVHALGNPTEFNHMILSKPASPEGFVAVVNGKPTKLVDREEFSRANFSNPKTWGEVSDFADDDETDDAFEAINPVVFSFGRLNPPTSGHAAVVAKVKSLAKKYGAAHDIVMSHSTDPEKNPLSGDEKLEFAKKFFPDTNLSVATPEEPNFLKQAERLYKKGHGSLIMVAGADRVAEYLKTLKAYNGEGPGKLFNFKSIKVVSAGMRDPDKEGVAGMSASKMRLAASEGDFKAFSQGVPPHVSTEDSKRLFDTLRAKMHIEINSRTSGISLARYAKHKDELGDRARAEIERRNRAVGFDLDARRKQRMAKNKRKQSAARRKALKESAYLLTESTPSLRTAIKAGDRIYRGHQGQLHQHLLDKHYETIKGLSNREKSEMEYGFVDHMGRFRNHEKAETFEFAKTNGLLDNKWAKGPPRSYLLSDFLKKVNEDGDTGSVMFGTGSMDLPAPTVPVAPDHEGLIKRVKKARSRRGKRSFA